MPLVGMFIKTCKFTQTVQLQSDHDKSTIDAADICLAKTTRNLKRITRKMSGSPWICSLILIFYFILRSSAVPIQDKQLNSLLQDFASDGVRYTRTVRIYSRSYRMHLRVVGSNIDAKALDTDPNALMILESVNLMGHIRIKSKQENTYICVSSAGRLVLEPKGNNIPRCVFVEDYYKGFTMFQSVYRKEWYLGVKKSGRMRQPRMTNRTQTASLFLVEHISLT
ncbi:putative fibroblast growth factor 1 [Actinia tenebrosa]|uniref:Fibroblast growth factor 1 n=1 Tax=Actinia tenebrosa TaxID=6105 RepID=A0A6P8I1G0_ACTTE|nr:putative fibroblast growth factor 1 [Actinia tenebrosa]